MVDRAAIHDDPAESWEAVPSTSSQASPTTARPTNPQLKIDRFLPDTFQASCRFAAYGLFMNIRLSSLSTFLLAGLFGVGLALAPMSGAEPREPVERDRVERELTTEREESEQSEESETAQREVLEMLETSDETVDRLLNELRGDQPERELVERIERDRFERELDGLDQLREHIDSLFTEIEIRELER